MARPKNGSELIPYILLYLLCGKVAWGQAAKIYRNQILNTDSTQFLTSSLLVFWIFSTLNRYFDA